MPDGKVHAYSGTKQPLCGASPLDTTVTLDVTCVTCPRCVRLLAPGPQPAPWTHEEIDLAQARRMPELHAFFEKRTVAELLMDANWLSQYLIFRHHQETTA